MLAFLAATLVACGGQAPAQDTPTPVPPVPTSTVESKPVEEAPTQIVSEPTKPAGQDDHITVQHILIGFKDAVGFQGRQTPPKAATRTQEQAKTLAYQLLEKAKAGEDFSKLATENSDDTPPGIYGLANNG